MESQTIKNTNYARSLIEASLDPFVTISLEGKITDVNEASIKATGISRKKLINTNFSDYFTDSKKAQEGYRQVFEKGFVSDYPLTIKHKNGNLTDVLYNASVYKDNKGNVLGVFAAARDITEQKQSSQYARSLIEASLDPLVTISPEGKITDVNEASIKVTGVSRKKLINTNFSDYFTDPKKAQEGYLKVFKKGFVVDYPLTIKHTNGKLTDVSYNASIYKDDAGNVLGVFAAARDVTEQKWAKDLRKANVELAFQNKEKGKRAEELIIANEELAFQNNEKGKRADELAIANKELAFQNDEKEKRADELAIANKELAFQNDEKGKRADELAIANKELAFQNDEKGKRAEELVIANKELAFQNDEKGKRAEELAIANKELAFQNDEKEKRAAELVIANEELAFQNEVKEKRAAELVIANEELAFQNDEKEKRAAELVIANEELAFQNNEKEKRSAELVIANQELAFQNNEKEKRAAELVIANGKLEYQNKVKEKRAAELVIANEELAFQNKEKEKRAAELVIANEELVFQTKVKEKRAAELVLANEELALQNIEAIKQGITNKELEASNLDIKLDSQYSLSLIEASLDPLVTISRAGKITDMNEALTNITGLTREELTDTEFLDYFTEPQKARAVYQDVFANGSVTNSPLTLRHKNGKLTDVLFNGSVYKDDDGNVDGIVIVARDVTEQKRIATELNEAIIFAEMATAIAEDAKIKAEKATIIAENAMKAKQQFLSNMSHEIRTPMNAIIGFTKVVLKTALTAKQKEYLKAIKISGDALIVLINDILDLAKVDAGKMTFEQIPFKMSLSISAMLHLFETKIREKNLKLVKEYDDRIPGVLVGDPVRLHQIIMNLVSNAVKFTTKGKITVGAKLLSEDDKEVTVEFFVSDTGIGIPENKIESIFENFQQASSGTSRLYGGTGLGLAIVKQLIEPQGGSIRVTSKVNEGSTFFFILSFLKTKAEVETESQFMELDTDIKNTKVLVVEDIPLNQLLMRTILDDFGFECDIAGNGKIAIEKMETKIYDLILMDLQMPEMNGFEATEYIRNKMKSKVPIIALTADVTTVDLAKCKAVGMNDYIAKPVDDRLLYSKMVGFLKKSSVTIEPDVRELAKIVKIKCTNLNYLNERTKSNRVLMMEMISLYLEQTPPLIGTMKQSLFDKDWKLLQATVHKMIPSFSIMGISADYEKMAREIQEYASTQQQTNNISEMVLKLEEICMQACSELEEDFNIFKNNK
ncbi:PAS domain S-box protein [Lutibacter sp.]|uniref:PAS domain S-box protein n=1 Tax=Lutibacter sp. TaxID=1925666 RepID=UPI003565CFE5